MIKKGLKVLKGVGALMLIPIILISFIKYVYFVWCLMF